MLPRPRTGKPPWYNPRMPAGQTRHDRDRDRDRDYVLGTHDDEIERLCFQHAVWRDEVTRAWSSAGLAPGARVVDVGAGPGFASLDLAERVGPAGEVLAVERSGRFARLLAGEAARRGLSTVRTAELDLMEHAIPTEGADLAWCRWVACFVRDPALLVDRMAACLRSGGTVVFHEYVEYASYRLLPVQPAVTAFVEAVYESWRAEGGEPDIARVLPTLLASRGFRIDSVRPIVRSARPGETLWQWPAGFARINARRLAATGRRDERWAQWVIDAVDAAERDPASVFMTPTVLEIIATKS
ncbi:MAG: Demethylmenaquinone methyltransferase [Planctomycetota bacterium]|jgi:SAM-dependent methyltransferase